MSSSSFVTRSAALALSVALFGCLNGSAFATANIVVIGNNVRVDPQSVTANGRALTGTHFPVAEPNVQTRTHQFWIRNTGDTSLAISSVTIGGAGLANYSVAQSPASSVGPGQQTSLAIRFAPLAAGTAFANVTIASNAANAPSFIFVVQGGGVAQSAIDPQDTVGCFGQPVKVKCKDGQCVASGTIFVANATTGKDNSYGGPVEVTVGQPDFADFTTSTPLLVADNVILDPPDPAKPLKFRKVKFSVPVPDGPFRLFGSVLRNDIMIDEINGLNNVFFTDTFELEP